MVTRPMGKPICARRCASQTSAALLRHFPLAQCWEERARGVSRDEAQGGGGRLHTVLSLSAGAGAHHSRLPWAAGPRQRVGERGERRAFRQILFGRAGVDRDDVDQAAEASLHPLLGRGGPTCGALLPAPVREGLNDQGDHSSGRSHPCRRKRRLAFAAWREICQKGAGPGITSPIA
jgi:hypothetical protein